MLKYIMMLYRLLNQGLLMRELRPIVSSPVLILTILSTPSPVNAKRYFKYIMILYRLFNQVTCDTRAAVNGTAYQFGP